MRELLGIGEPAPQAVQGLATMCVKYSVQARTQAAAVKGGCVTMHPYRTKPPLTTN
jgi:hypothetical protein